MFSVSDFLMFTALLPMLMCAVLFVSLVLNALYLAKDLYNNNQRLEGFLVRLFGHRVEAKYQIVMLAILNIAPALLIKFFFDDLVKSADIILFFGIPCLIVIFLVPASLCGDRVFSNIHVCMARGMLICALLNSAGGIIISFQIGEYPFLEMMAIALFSVLYASELKKFGETLLSVS
jgi:hypothetical protein